MWECKDLPLERENTWDKKCSGVEKCPMEHWVETVIWGEEWDIWTASGCKICPLRKVEERRLFG